MITAILTNLSEDHNSLRTEEVLGVTPHTPQVGEPFQLIGESLDPGCEGRFITTSTVQEVRLHPDEGSLEFWTRNSHYGLQLLDVGTPDSLN